MPGNGRARDRSVAILPKLFYAQRDATGRYSKKKRISDAARNALWMLWLSSGAFRVIPVLLRGAEWAGCTRNLEIETTG